MRIFQKRSISTLLFLRSFSGCEMGNRCGVCILCRFSYGRKGKIMYYDPMECGMRISKLRMECGKTQQQMADKLNISLDHYRALENGRRGGSLDLLIELAITFDISLDYLILGRVKYSDSERIQRELEKIMGQIGQLKASL